jgi:hypothetical protein
LMAAFADLSHFIIKKVDLYIAEKKFTCKSLCCWCTFVWGNEIKRVQ